MGVRSIGEPLSGSTLPGRNDIVQRIAALVGSDVLQITNAASGWPALGTLTIDGRDHLVSVFAAHVGRSQRGRDSIERRFQNPGQDRPITQEDPSRYPLLLGLWDNDDLLSVSRPLLVSADPFRRMNLPTRYSVFVGTSALREALTSGWAEASNASGETVRCFVPSLLPASVASDQDQASPAAGAVRAVIAASGVLVASPKELPVATSRAREAALRLVRDARFARRVLDAYGGLCGMCGLDVGLVQGAHIYPAAAPGSTDDPQNGLALCPNHHASFDRHLIAVRPTSLQIVFNEPILQQTSTSAAVQALVGGTFAQLAAPGDPTKRPTAEMFEARYSHFSPLYAWLD